MDVRSRLFVITFFLYLLTACQKKTAETVFSEAATPNVTCQTESEKVQNIEDKFMVVWESGAVTFEKAENKDVFIKNFLKPHLAEIKHVEFDKIITFLKAENLSTVDTAAAGSDYYWGQIKIGADSVWGQNLLGEGTIVGVVDAAVDYDHPQLKPNLLVNSAELNGVSGTDDDGNGLIDDVYGYDFFAGKPKPDLPADATNNHGSHVAGIIAADSTAGNMTMKGVDRKSVV